MTEMFVRDITTASPTPVSRPRSSSAPPTNPGVTRGVERVLRAVAQAHRQTGVPISTHTHAASRRGLDQQRIFAEEGVDLSRVVIGHCGDTTDLAYLEELIAAGSVSRDGPLRCRRLPVVRGPRRHRRHDCARAATPSRLVLSHDASCYFDALPEATLPVALPNWHYLHIHNDVLPALRRQGVTEEQITTMLVDNPRRIFERRGGY